MGVTLLVVAAAIGFVCLCPLEVAGWRKVEILGGWGAMAIVIARLVLAVVLKAFGFDSRDDKRLGPFTIG